jgi:hypothetical protein
MKPHRPIRSLTQAFAVVLAMALPVSIHAQEDSYMIEVLALKPGATVNQAEQYFTAVYPVIASHGLFPIKAYKAMQQGGDSSPKIIQIWRVANPNGMPEIFKDPNYLKHVPTRDSIFDLKGGRIGWMGNELY